MAPSPAPLDPPVEKPSRMHAVTFAMPGPLSSARTSRQQAGDPEAHARRRISPPPPCWITLLAASVTMSATRPVACSLNPFASASAMAKRRASPTPLVSTIDTDEDIWLAGTVTPIASP